MRLRTKWVILAVGLVAFVAGCGGGGTSDPESARCENPSPTFDQAREVGDHREVAGDALEDLVDLLLVVHRNLRTAPLSAAARGALQRNR